MGIQPYPLADRLPKVRPSSQKPYNTALSVALPFKETRLRSRHQNSPLTKKPSQGAGPTSPTGDKLHSKKDCNYAAVKRRP